MKVYVITQSYEGGKDVEHEESKFIDVYSSKNIAEQTVNYYSTLPDFSQYPKSCFYIEEYELDKNAGWEEASKKE